MTRRDRYGEEIVEDEQDHQTEPVTPDEAKAWIEHLRQQLTKANT